MDLSTPLRRISAAGAQIVGRITEEIERPATGAGEDAPEGAASINELDEILDVDGASVVERNNVRFSSDPAGDKARSGRKFSLPADDVSVEYSISGSSSAPDHTSKYDAIDRRDRKKRPKGRGLLDVLGHDLKVQVHSPKIAASDHRSKFALLDDIPDEDIQDQDVVLKKANYGTPGSDNYRKNMLMAVSSLDGKFGVQSHKIIDWLSGAKQDGDQRKSSYVQKVIVDVLHRVAEGHLRSKSVDFMDICILPKLDPNAVGSEDCGDWWDTSTNNIWLDWDTMTLDQVSAWQYCINKRFGTGDRTASIWLKEFVYNSSTMSLRSAVATKYNKLRKNCKGGVVYTYLTLCEMFQMSKEIKQAMLSFLDRFHKLGIASYQGENILLASEEVLGVCRRLNSINAITSEHIHDVLVGLSIAQNSRFRKMFECMAHSADLGTTILPNIPYDATPLDIIELCWEKAVDMHDFLSTTGQWNVAKKGGGLHVANSNSNSDHYKCWNCEKTDCNLRKCKEPKDQQRIERNKKLYQDRVKNGDIKPGRKQNNDRKKGKKGEGGDTQYRRKVWDKSNMAMVNGALHVKCKKCGMNQTHSSGFHDAWNRDRANFVLPDTHPYSREKCLLAGVASMPTAPTRPPTPKPTSVPTSDPDTLTFSRAELETKIAHTERNSTDPNASSIASMLRSMFLN